MKKNKAEVKYTVGEGDEAVEKTLIVRKPNSKDKRDANVVYARAFNQAVQNGAMLNDRLSDYLIEQGLWSEKQEEELKKIMKELAEKQKKLEAGGIKLSEARDLAIDIRKLRFQWTKLLSKTAHLKENTAEGQAENERFHYLCSVCLVDEEGNPIFENVDEYLEHGDEPHILRAAQELLQLEADLDPDWEENLPENQFLKKYKFVNDDLSLVNADGHLVDAKGRLINEDGFLVNEQGQMIDDEGNVIEKMEEEAVFYDDEGNPV